MPYDENVPALDNGLSIEHVQRGEQGTCHCI